MMRSVRFVVTLLILASLIPIVPILPWFVTVPNIANICAIGVACLSLLLAIREFHNERERRENRRNIELTKERVAAMEAEKADQNRKDAINSLDAEALADKSEAGYHWQVLQPSVDINDYYHYLSIFEESPYKDECYERTSQLSNWKNHVNHDDPIDISYFLMSRPYFALAREARDALANAIAQAPDKHEAQFWGVVGQPLWVFFPFLYILSFSMLMIPVWIFEQTASPELQPVVDYVVGMISDGMALIPPDWVQVVAQQILWIETHVASIAIGVVGSLLTIIAGFTLFYGLAAIGWVIYEWHASQRHQLRRSLEVAFDDQHKGLL